MAYSSVGRPRFYINTLAWLDSLGLITGGALKTENMLYLPPSGLKNWVSPTDTDNGYNDTRTVHTSGFSMGEVFKKNVYAAFLGHNFASSNSEIRYYHYRVGDNTSYNSFPGATEVVNKQFDYDGFSIVSWDDVGIPAEKNAISIRMDSPNYPTPYPVNPTICSAILGTYYSPPHSPDLNLTMTREYGGHKEITTKGGASLSNSCYRGSPSWGEAGAWELYASDSDMSRQKLARSGRRVWDLSFSYLQDSDVFGIQVLDGGKWGNQTDLGWEAADLGTGQDNTGKFNYNLLTDDSFYTQVIHKLNGGQSAFIFQPDVNDNTNFAIAKFASGFKFDQVANGVYNVKLKIREVW